MSERETIFRTDETMREWIVETASIPHINKLKQQGWVCTCEDYYSDGTLKSACFIAPKKCLTIRKNDPDKPKRSLQPKERQQLASRLEKWRNDEGIA